MSDASNCEISSVLAAFEKKHIVIDLEKFNSVPFRKLCEDCKQANMFYLNRNAFLVI